MASVETGRKRFASLFIESVNEAFTGILGAKAAEAFFKQLEVDYSIRRDEVFSRLNGLINAVERIFGAANKIVQRAIAKRFYGKLEMEFVERRDCGLLEYVEDALFGRVKKAVGEGEVVSSRDEMQTAVAFTERMKPRDHVIMFYSDPEHKHELLFPYLKAGLDGGEAAAYVSSQESPDQIRKDMKAHGIDVKRYEKSGALHLFHYTEWYFLGGEFNIGKTMELWKKLYDQATAKGYKGLRVTGEMACFFEKNKINELILYERTLHRVLDIPITAICAYDIRLVPTRILRDLIEAHSNAILMGEENRLVVPS